jgi:hypothetical protein
MMPATDTKPNAHFLRLVGRGRHPGCSTSERACRIMAKAILDHVSSLDGKAMDGLHDWIDVCRSHPTTAGDFLEGR